MKKWIFFLLLAIETIAVQSVFAVGVTSKALHEFEWQGIKYRVIDEEAKTCMTKPRIFTNGVGYDYSPRCIDGHLDIPEKVYDGDSSYTVIKIGDNSFRDCASLTSINIHDKVNEIHQGAFSGCKSLASIVLPSHLKYIDEELFSGCKSLKHIEIPNEVEEIRSQAFVGCSNLSMIKLSSSLKKIGQLAFLGCSLTEIEFPESLQLIEDAYEDCPGKRQDTEFIGTFQGNHFKRLVFPDNMEKLGTFAFQNINELEYVKLPKNMKDISEAVFLDCENLKEVSLPKSLERIGKGAFSGCCSLQSLEVPDGIKRLQCTCSWNIEWYLEELYFIHSTGLTYLKKLTIPETINVIDPLVFYTYDLTELYYMTSNPKEIYNINGDVRRLTDKTYQECVLYVGIGGLEAARKTEPWKNFVNIQEYDFSGVEDLADDVEINVTTEVFDMQGRKVAESDANLPSGLYIIRQGDKVSKTIR